MSDADLYQLLNNIARLEDMTGPLEGPWRCEYPEDDGIWREVSYANGYLTLRSHNGTETIETTERYLPENQRQAYDRWMEIKAVHMGELLQLLFDLQDQYVAAGGEAFVKKTGLPN